jgi:signal transduction histidine kinase
MLQRRKSGHTERFDTEQVTKTMFLYGDKRLFRQIILNLLSNANKFTPDDGVIIVSSYVDGDDRTVVQVIDTGRGIASEDIPKALEPFGQARVDSLITHEGTGLGLPLSQKLMELHGGTLEIESELGVGTVVTITFPTERTVIVK